MSERPILYGYGASTYVRTALLAFEEKGVEYDFVTVASWDGYRKDPAFANLHPFAKVPILDHREARIYETLAICTYVDEVFDGPSLQPIDPLTVRQRRCSGGKHESRNKWPNSGHRDS